MYTDCASSRLRLRDVVQYIFYAVLIILGFRRRFRRPAACRSTGKNALTITVERGGVDGLSTNSLADLEPLRFQDCRAVLSEPVYTIQPVVKPVVQPVVNNRFHNRLNVCLHDAAGCSTAVVKPHKRLNNRFDNRLNVCIHDTTGCQTG